MNRQPASTSMSGFAGIIDIMRTGRDPSGTSSAIGNETETWKSSVMP